MSFMCCSQSAAFEVKQALPMNRRKSSAASKGYARLLWGKTIRNTIGTVN